MRAYLKVKIKSLAAEARIIRLEEHRIAFRKATHDELVARQAKALGFSKRQHNGSNGSEFPYSPIKQTTRILATRSEKARTAWFGLNSHRRNEVRIEARAAQLAYAYLRGRDYGAVEDVRKTEKPIDYNRVATNVMKFGNLPDRKETLKALEVWVKASVDEGNRQESERADLARAIAAE